MSLPDQAASLKETRKLVSLKDCLATVSGGGRVQNTQGMEGGTGVATPGTLNAAAAVAVAAAAAAALVLAALAAALARKVTAEALPLTT